MNHSLILTIMLGAISGIIGGALGQSGVNIMLPGLIILGLVPNFKTAVGTVLLTLVPPTTLLACITYYQRKQIDIKTSLILFVTCFITYFFGAYLTKNIANRTLEFITGIYLFFVSMFFIWNSYTGRFGE